jgi:hypothetical protein
MDGSIPEVTQMTQRNKWISICLALFVLLAVGLMGCTSKSQPVKSDTDGQVDTGSDPRVVSPEWEETDAGEPVEIPVGGSPPNTQIHGDWEINITFLIDGTVHPMDMPLAVYDGVQMEAEFRITAMGSELASYRIESAAPINLAQEGELEGFSTTIPYVFTYVQDSWGEDGIIIQVMNRQGNIDMRNVILVPAQIPGYNR